MVQRKQIRLGAMRLQVRSLASLSGLRIQHCCELWCRSQMQLGSDVAVAAAQVRGYSSHLTPNLGTSRCCRCSSKRQKNIYLYLCFSENAMNYKQVGGGSSRDYKGLLQLGMQAKVFYLPFFFFATTKQILSILP